MKIGFFIQSIGGNISGTMQYPWYIAQALNMLGNEILIITNSKPLFLREFEFFPKNKQIRIIVDLNYGSKNKDTMNEMKKCDFFVSSAYESTDYAVTLGQMFRKKVVGICTEPETFKIEAYNNGCELLPVSSEEPMRIPGTNFMTVSTEQSYMKQLHKCFMIICPNKTIEQKTKEWFPNYKGQITHLYMPINSFAADKINLMNNNIKNEITFCSRTIPCKGYENVLNILLQMPDKPVLNYISGFIDKMNKKHHEFFENCKQAGIKLNKYERITDIEKFRIMTRSKAVLMPSMYEPIGMTFLEAVAMKTPVVAYEQPVLKEISEGIKLFPYSDIDSLIHFFNNDYNVNSKLVELTSELNPKHKFTNFINNVGLLFKSLGIKNEIINGTEFQVKKEIYIPKEEIKTKEIKKVKKIKKKGKKMNCSIEESIAIVVLTEEDIILDLKSQTHKKWNTYFFNKIADIDYRNIKEDKIVLIRGCTQLKNRALELIMSAFTMKKCDIIVSNYSIDDKEYRLPEFSKEILKIRPGYIQGMIAIKKEILRETYQECEISQENWEHDLLKEFSKNTVFHIEYNLYKTDDIVHKELEFSKFKKIFNPVIKEESKVLMVVCARNCKNIQNLITKDSKKEIDIVVGIHAPDGKPDKELVEFCKFQKLKTLEFNGKFNFSYMNNELIKEFGKDYDYYILSNDDIVLGERCIYSLISAFELDENIGIVGAKLLYPEGDIKPVEGAFWFKEELKIQHAGVNLISDLLAIHSYKGIRGNRVCVNYPRFCEAVTFGLVAIESTCYKKILLDRKYPLDFNDIDFCIRAREKGWMVLYNPLAVARHYESFTRKQFNDINDLPSKILFREQYKDILVKCPTYQEMLTKQKGVM